MNGVNSRPHPRTCPRLQVPLPLLWRKVHSKESAWLLTMVAPYVALLLMFTLYPIGASVWMGARASLYAELLSDPRYIRAVINTALFAGASVTIQMVLALLLSGFFAARRRWAGVLMVVCVLPWLLPSIPVYLSFHWMLVAGRQGLLDRLLFLFFDLRGPRWLLDGRLALACDIAVYVWKWTPLWTLVLLGGRQAIPNSLYEAAALDGASPWCRFRYITLPSLAGVCLTCVLIATIFSVTDYRTVMFVSNSRPGFSSEVISVLAFHDAFYLANPRLAVAAGLAILPALVPLVVLLTRGLRAAEQRP